MARVNYNTDINTATELHVDIETSKAFIHVYQCYIRTVKRLPMCFPLTLLSSPKECFGPLNAYTSMQNVLQLAYAHIRKGGKSKRFNAEVLSINPQQLQSQMIQLLCRKEGEIGAMGIQFRQKREVQEKDTEISGHTNTQPAVYTLLRHFKEGTIEMHPSNSKAFIKYLLGHSKR